MPKEQWEQEQVVEQLRTLGVLCTAVPNDAPRSKLGHVLAKRRGVTRGAPDLLVFTPPPAEPWRRGVAIEMKKRKGGVTSGDQESFLADLAALGWATYVAHGAQDALAFLSSLGYAVAVLGPAGA